MAKAGTFGGVSRRTKWSCISGAIAYGTGARQGSDTPRAVRPLTSAPAIPPGAASASGTSS